MTPYSHEERARARSAVSRIHALASAAKDTAQRGLILPAQTLAGIVELTGVSEPSRQVDALSSMGLELQKRHMARLLPLARDEFNAFCEYVSPDEPPASPWHLWLTDKLQQIELDPALNRFILNCPPGVAKPLSVETLVLMGDGGWKRLGDIVVGDKVISGAGRARRVSAVHEQGVLPLLKLTTRAGRVVHTAFDHPFSVRLGPSHTRYARAEDLRPGDRLDMVGGPPRPSVQADTSGQSLEMFLLAANYGALGGYTQANRSGRKFQMWFADLGEFQACASLCNRLGIEIFGSYDPHGKHYVLRLSAQRGNSYETPLRLAERACERRVPAWVFLGDDDKVRAYLSTVLELRGALRRHRRVVVHVTRCRSLAFVHDLQRLLARFGVDAEVIAGGPGASGHPKGALQVRGGALEALLNAGLRFKGWGEPAFTAQRVRLPTALADEVKTVEIAPPGACRCLSVTDDASFVAEGMVVHNSTYASRLFVAWRMGRNPRLKIIGGGHTQRFVENQFSKKIRNMIRSQAFKDVFPGIGIDHATAAADQWAIAGFGGEYAAKGAGQAVHGFRANFVVVDDPYAKIEIAESPTERAKIETWFTGDLGSRMLPFGKMFVIQTRFHENDLTGYLEAMNPLLPAHDRWQIVTAPALCIDPESDVLGRRLGEVLWDYYNLSYYVTKKAEWKYQRFALVYQQIADAASETSVAGAFQYYKRLPHQTEAAIKTALEGGFVDDLGRGKPDKRAYFRRITVSVDCAAKTTQRADWTVVQVWGETIDRKQYLIDQDRVKVAFNDMISHIERMAIKHGADRILVEDKGQGTAYIQNRGATAGQRRLAPAPIIGIDPGQQSKEFRFDEVSPMIADSQVFLPQYATWIDGFVREVGQFPAGAHDDQVDAMTQYLRWAKGARTKYGSRKIAKHG